MHMIYFFSLVSALCYDVTYKESSCGGPVPHSCVKDQ
jgi:hypothetical protein